MAEGRAPVLVHSPLCGCEDVAAVLDGARADQHMPVRLAGLLGKSGRDRDERGTGLRQRAVERRETQVVADRQAEPAPGQVGHDGAFARTETARLPIALATREIDVEHVDLVVARDDLARAVDQVGPIYGTI